VGSEEVNAYLKDITGQDFTSKDFRTWAGTVLAAQLLREFEAFTSDTQARKNILAAVEMVAKRLGNTKAVCRRCYIHPAIFDAYMDGSMLETIAQRARKVSRAVDRLTDGEAVVLRLLTRRISRSSRQRKAS
jgi:DNA topoisomerase-1